MAPHRSRNRRLTHFGTRALAVAIVLWIFCTTLMLVGLVQRDTELTTAALFAVNYALVASSIPVLDWYLHHALERMDAQSRARTERIIAEERARTEALIEVEKDRTDRLIAALTAQGRLRLIPAEPDDEDDEDGPA